jgi:Replication-relaxation
VTATATRTTNRAARLADLAHRLTERDRRLCRLVWDHRVLTTEQLTDLCFPSRDAATHRLMLLARLGILDRFRPFRFTGSAPYHYVLGELGAQVLAAERGLSTSELGYNRTQTLAIAHSQRLAHQVGVNGFFAALAAAARRRREATLLAWWSERRCAQRWGRLVRPDGFGRWAEAGRTVEFFLEWDAGTETLAKVAGKLRGYADLAAGSGIWTPVLLWLPSPGREAEIRRAIATPPVPVASAHGRALDPSAAVWLPTGAHTRRLRLAALGTRADR